MIKNINLRKTILLLTFLLCLSIYYLLLSKNPGTVKIEKITSNQTGITKFNNVEYITYDKKNREYQTFGSLAYILSNNENIIHLEKVITTTMLEDNSKLIIESKNATYDKTNKQIEYKNSVNITNNLKKITCDYANYIPQKNLIELKGNVKILHEKNIILADLAIIDTELKNVEIKMNKKNKNVYGKKEK